VSNYAAASSRQSVPVNDPSKEPCAESSSRFDLNTYEAKLDKLSIGLANWPIESILKRAVLLSGENQLELNLPAEVQEKEDHPFADSPSLEEVQRRYIRDVLKRTGGRIAGPGGAAEILGMKRTSPYSRIRALGMARQETEK